MSVEKERRYLATFVLDTRGVEASVEELSENIKTVIESIGGKVEHVEQLGSTPFVRRSRKGPDDGIFIQYSFAGDPESPVKLREKFRLDRKVDRLMIQSAA